MKERETVSSGLWRGQIGVREYCFFVSVGVIWIPNLYMIEEISFKGDIQIPLTLVEATYSGQTGQWSCSLYPQSKPAAWTTASLPMKEWERGRVGSGWTQRGILLRTPTGPRDSPDAHSGRCSFRLSYQDLCFLDYDHPMEFLIWNHSFSPDSFWVSENILLTSSLHLKW